MDITSGDVSFGRTCPGTLMQKLQRDQASDVAKIKKLQTSFSQREVADQCPLPCEDLDIVHKFITSIAALEELAILNYEPDGSALWPAIFHHAPSLHSLAIHTPPQDESRVWTAESAAAVAERLPNLTHLELDLPLEEAEALVAASQRELGVVHELSKLRRLRSLHVNVPLEDGGSSFADEHTWDEMGSISFPDPNKQVCDQLARAIMDKFPADSAIEKVHVRFVRRMWDDRCQFWTLGYSMTVDRREGEVVVEDGADWVEYMVEWPEHGGVLWELLQEYMVSEGATGFS